MKSLNEVVAIDLALRNWKPCYPQDSPNWIAAELYRLSTWVYLWRTVNPSQPNDKISGVVNDGLAPTQKVRERDLTAAYNKLKKAPRDCRLFILNVNL